MAQTTSISWTDLSWNPVTGCSHVSPGCQNCYAEALSLRFGRSKHPWGAQWAAENVVLHPERLDQPLKWRKPQKVFVNSMSDLFHEQIPTEFIDKVFGVMAGTPRHTFQVLTKRPERMLAYLADEDTKRRIWTAGRGPVERVLRREMYDVVPVAGPGRGPEWCYPAVWPLPNVWLGVSAENQRWYDWRAPILAECPAAVRFISYEPALEGIDFGSLAFVKLPRRVRADFPFLNPSMVANAGVHKAYVNPHGAVSAWTPGGWLGIKPDEMEWCRKISWVICGGESGPKRRAFNLDWARQTRNQCIAAGVPFWFKQDGGLRPGMNPTLDGVEWHQFPEVRG